MISRATSSVLPYVTAAELADWLRVDEADNNSVLSVIVSAVSDAIINLLGRELLQRDRVATWREWDYIGTDMQPSLSPTDAQWSLEYVLPFSGSITTIGQVLVNGEVITDYTTKNDGREIVIFDSITEQDDVIALQITYTTADYPSASDLPSDVKMAALQMGAYMFEHRGECSVSDAMLNSGARDMLMPYKRDLVVM